MLIAFVIVIGRIQRFIAMFDRCLSSRFGGINVSQVGWASPTICLMLIAFVIGRIQRFIAMFDRCLSSRFGGINVGNR
ncbi:MAG: hypothetical protein VR64_22395 [Desulfatitalea sp. BRH_c12]|nr:MAG: hypothetical protein VR64_22395 [Desulfatitalea sp. BRH_c12]